MRLRRDKAHTGDMKHLSRLRRRANFGSTSDPTTFRQAVREKKDSHLKQMYLSDTANVPLSPQKPFLIE